MDKVFKWLGIIWSILAFIAATAFFLGGEWEAWKEMKVLVLKKEVSQFLPARIAKLEGDASKSIPNGASVHFESDDLEIHYESIPELHDFSRCVEGPTNERGLKGRVNFKTPFSTPPEISIGLTTLAASVLRVGSGDMTDSLRITVGVKEVDTHGFNFTFHTWCHTKVSAARARWLAIGYK